MAIDRNQIREGMTVHSADGEKLGKVLTADDRSFIVEKGFFFPKDYVARYEDVADVSGDDVRLRAGAEALRGLDQGEGLPDAQAGRPGAGERATGAAIAAEPAAGMAATGPAFGAESAARSGAARAEEVRVPVAEEVVEAEKREREAGEVRLRKDVVTEQRHVDVPVTREEVHVEHVASSPARAPAPGEKTFQEQTVSIPVREEEVEIRKRPVVKEEIRARKERVTEQRAADVEVRKERVDVEGDERTTRREPPDEE